MDDTLARDLAWRRTEMQYMRSSIRDTSGPASDCLRRGGVALLYAHWEGYTKNALSAYWDYVATKKLSYQELSLNFMALGIERELNRVQSATTVTRLIGRVERLLSCHNDRALMSERDIDTQSNLNSEVLAGLFEKLNLDISQLVTKSNLIDANLLKARNSIAHGEYLPVTKEAYEELHTEVMSMMTIVNTIVSNAASTAQYRR